jgi:hypothetical protein
MTEVPPDCDTMPSDNVLVIRCAAVGMTRLTMAKRSIMLTVCAMVAMNYCSLNL